MKVITQSPYAYVYATNEWEQEKLDAFRIKHCRFYYRTKFGSGLRYELPREHDKLLEVLKVLGGETKAGFRLALITEKTKHATN